jgi:hypothetical protein
MKKEEKRGLQERHWMHCPKCGMKRVEIKLEGTRKEA